MREETLDTTLESLYVVNQQAHKYAQLGTENYRQGKKTTAKANSNKKKAIYALKERVLTALMDAGVVDRVERHTIHGDPFWCVYVADSDGQTWSFHSPTDVLDVDSALVDEDGAADLEEFEATSEKEHSTRSLKASLLHFEAEYDLNANEFLPDSHLWYGHSRHFIGWTYLGETDDENDQATLSEASADV